MKKIFTAMVLSASIVSAAQAATVIQHVDFNNTLTDFTLAKSFNLFDSALGTLTGVTISSSYNFSTTITVTNNGNSPIDGTASTSSYLAGTSDNTAINTAINGNSNNNLNLDKSTVSATGFKYAAGANTLDPNDPSQGLSTFNNLAPNTPTTLDSVFSTTGTRSITISDLTNLAAFLASPSLSTANLIAQTQTFSTTQTQGGNVTATQATNANANFVITYTYTAATAAVPEPATWAMMIAGFGLVGYGMRRRGTAVVFS